VPGETFHREWERRRLRNVVHLTIGGCLGPCALANVALLLFDGQAQWFHSVNSAAMAVALYDHVDRMLAADGCLPPPPALASFHFSGSAWQPRPDGQPVDDRRPRPPVAPGLLDGPRHSCPTPMDGGAVRLEGVAAALDGGIAQPRKNGELVFDEPWQGRAFGMAVALSEGGLFPWEEFRQALIREIAAAEARGGEFRYYDAWLAALEGVLASRGLVIPEQLEEVAFQFEFGERDEVF